MAYVAITEKLIGNVRSQIGRYEQTEIDAMVDPDKLRGDIAATDAFRQFVRDRLWGDLIDLEERLRPYCRTANVWAAVTPPASVPEYSALPPLSVSIPNFDNVPPFVKTGYYSEAKTEFNADVYPEFIDVFKHTAGRRDCRARWEAVKNQIIGYLRQCKSLNEAVTLWPDVRRFIPSEYLDKLEEKRQPKPKVVEEQTVNPAVEALKNMDSELITASTTLARMAGAKV